MLGVWHWIFFGWFALVLILFVLNAFLHFSMPFAAVFPLHDFLTLCICIVLAAILALFLKSVKLSDRPFYIAFGVTIGVFFLVQCFVFYSAYHMPRGDLGMLLSFSDAIVEDGDLEMFRSYFELCPNNLFLVSLFVLLKRIGLLLHINGHVLCVLFGGAVAAASGGLLMLCIRKLTKSDTAAFLFGGLFLLSVALSPRGYLPYSDTLGLLFPILVLFLYSCRGQSLVRNAVLYGFMGFTGLVGYAVKPTAVIALIAVFILELGKLIFCSERKERAICLGVSVGGMLVGYGFTRLMLLLIPIALDTAHALTLWHYLFMGANPDTLGTYSSADVAFSSSLSPSERTVQTLSAWAERVGGMGLSYLVFLGHKLIFLFFDGGFGWQYELEFVNYYPEVTTSASDALRALFTNSAYFQFSQFCWVFVLICCAGILLRRSRDTDVTAALLSLTGLVLFLLFFEAAARYLYLYLPVFYLVAAVGFTEWRKILKPVGERLLRCRIGRA